MLSGSKKISELPAAGAITGAELVEIVQAGVNKQTTTSAFGGGGGSLTDGNGTTANGTAVDSGGAVTANITYSDDGTHSLTGNSFQQVTLGATVGTDQSFIQAIPTQVSIQSSDGVDAAELLVTSTDVKFNGASLVALDASETVKGIMEIATQAEVTTGTDDLRAITPLKLATETRGVQDLFVPAAAMWPRITGGCSAIAQSELATSLFNIQSLDFDQTTQEFAQFQLVLPRKWNNGTITAVVYWTAAAGSGTVQWGISLGAYRDDDALTVALGAAQTSDDTLIATNDLHISPATAAITAAGTVQDAVFLAVQISRNPGSDTLSADAKLLGVSFRITTDSAKDA